MTYFDVLGITQDASDDDVAAAYHRLARRFHPDAHPNASADERAACHARMAELNVAYEALKDAHRRAGYLHSHHRESETARDAAAVRCALCGATPASRVQFSGGKGTPSWTAHLCPRCARSALAPTPPQRTYDLTRHRRRLRLATSVVVVGTLMALGAIELRNLRNNIRANTEPLTNAVGPLTSALTHDSPWLSHDCVSTTSGTVSIMLPVDCAQPHDGRIVARVTPPDDCPADTDELNYDPATNFIICIKTTN